MKKNMKKKRKRYVRVCSIVAVCSHIMSSCIKHLNEWKRAAENKTSVRVNNDGHNPNV